MSELEQVRAALVKLDELEAALDEISTGSWEDRSYLRQIEEMRESVTRRLKRLEWGATDALRVAWAGRTP